MPAFKLHRMLPFTQPLSVSTDALQGDPPAIPVQARVTPSPSGDPLQVLLVNQSNHPLPLRDDDGAIRSGPPSELSQRIVDEAAGGYSPPFACAEGYW